jgi:hypothetical protein
MNKKQSIMLALAGAALAVVSQAQAQPSTTYAADDLLLNYRDTFATGPVSGSDMEINAGPISAIAALPMGTTITLASASLSPFTSGGALHSAVVNGNLGFSAAAADPVGTTGTLWLTRPEASANVPGPAPTEVSYSIANPVATDISLIGTGYNSGTAINANTATVGAGTTGNSYQAQAEQNTSVNGQANINYQNQLGTAANAGGLIESIGGAGNGTIYEALWQQPDNAAGNTTPEEYLGYFTLEEDGTTLYTSAVPEASTYGLIAGLGLLGLALRRQFRALAA